MTIRQCRLCLQETDSIHSLVLIYPRYSTGLSNGPPARDSCVLFPQPLGFSAVLQTQQKILLQRCRLTPESRGAAPCRPVTVRMFLNKVTLTNAPRYRYPNVMQQLTTIFPATKERRESKASGTKWKRIYSKGDDVVVAGIPAMTDGDVVRCSWASVYVGRTGESATLQSAPTT